MCFATINPRKIYSSKKWVRCLASGLSSETGVLLVAAFLVLELLFSLSWRSRKYAPAVLALALIFTTVFVIYLLFKGLKPSLADIERQIVKNVDMVRGTA